MAARGGEFTVAQARAIWGATGGAMHRTLTVEECLERACRLMLMADEAKDYQQILTYDGLAQEWLELAARATRGSSAAAPEQAPLQSRRFRWREFRSWFR